MARIDERRWRRLDPTSVLFIPLPQLNPIRKNDISLCLQLFWLIARHQPAQRIRIVNKENFTFKLSCHAKGNA